MNSFPETVIENIVRLPFTRDNHVSLLESGPETFTSLLDSVLSAEQMICIEFYIFRDDNTGVKLANALKKKVREGVKIYLLYDHFGSFLTSRKFWSGLKKEGISVRTSHPFKWSSPREYIYRNHKKLLVIDGKKAFVGGFNIADEYHGYIKKKSVPWHDTVIYLEGPIASSLYNIFMVRWKRWKGEPVPEFHYYPLRRGGVPVIPVFATSGRARRRMRKLLLYSINNSNKSILITTAYFNPGRKILKALINAAKKGIKLKMMLPGESDVMPVFYAGRSHYTKLLRAGIEIYNYKKSILHSKTAVFDGCWSIVGSANFDVQSLRRNEESNVGILDSNFGARMKRAFDKDLEKSVRIDPDLWEKRPIHSKIMEKFFSMIMKKL